ncbi:hypothetical protein K431DRAFT_350407 [Polychaeton citri CBS 116435]|uniref:Nucleoporin NUP49/NSP49 n=1 Tax=Polychaeton citri CBS 116435 TaxID=1314669 RepID=A0A9P4UI16_9PEZI|nr:hypothetical protein K431DRAFT_350407 [Polychaeton citri CBS 116435]
MAFGRSNSLSINTGATNSLFSQQNQASQPTAGGSLFGGSLFGGGNQNQQQSQQQNQSGSSGLFGGAANPPNTGGSLFGGNTNQNQNQNTGSSLFGNTQNKPQPTSNVANGFGGISSNQPTQPSQQSTGSLGLFGNHNQPQQSNTGIFGGSGGQSQQQQQFQPQQSTLYRPPPGPYSTFGASAVSQPPSLLARSMLSATQYNQAQFPASGFTGKLSMGQGGTSISQPGGTQPQSAQKFDWQSVRPTTRFSDLREDCQKDIEELDKMIQAQEDLCAKIEAFLPKHGESVASLSPDVSLITEKAEGVEAALATDAQGVEAMKRLAEGGQKDFLRCVRILQNQQLPVQYQMPSIGYGSMYGGPGSATQTKPGGVDSDDSTYDTDLVGNYFAPLTKNLHQTLEQYADSLTEIEAHVSVMERGAVHQAQALAAKRSGMQPVSGDGGVDATIRELADTLRGFEGSILNAAGEVSKCREGVNGLVLGRIGGAARLR